MPERPTVAVVVPFAGGEDELRRLVADLRRVELREGDEVLVADNRPRAAREDPRRGTDGAVRVVDAAGVASPGFARNAAAAHTRAEWLLFLDADTRPVANVIDAYFDPPPAADVGILGGGIADVAARESLIARYVVAREMMHQRATLRHPHRGFVKTANCAVRRSAFAAVGGFEARARAGEDADLCWRLAEAGWRLDLRPRAQVEHLSRDTLRSLLSQLAVHGAGAAWLDRRHPGADPPPRPRQLLGRLKHYPPTAWREWRAGRREEAMFVLVDLLALYAYDAGRLRSNRATGGRPRRARRRRAAVLR